MVNLTQAQREITDHMRHCEMLFSRPFSELEAANLFDENNRFIDTVKDNALFLPTMTSKDVLASLENYKQILMQHMPKFRRLNGPG